ncbi:hypothetical protein MG295_00145 [Bacillus phage vB_BcgM]|nr:hypothetical protein MG295_00145 [Bacillus phage vB_BcgM]
MSETNLKSSVIRIRYPEGEETHKTIVAILDLMLDNGYLIDEYINPGKEGEREVSFVKKVTKNN